MAESVEVIERRIDELRAAVRRAVIAGDRIRAKALRAELRGAEQAWERALNALEGRGEPTGQVADDGDAEARRDQTGGASSRQLVRRPGPLLPLREQVHHALTLLAVPAAPKLIAEVHAAFFGPVTGEMSGARLTHLRRDEERSFRAAPYARPYYLCAALTADHLSPARGLLAISTWALERRMIGPLSPRVDFLTAAVNIAEHAGRMVDSDGVGRLLWRFAMNIPGAVETFHRADRPAGKAEAVAEAARAELVVHAEADRAHRREAAERAAALTDVTRLFGNRLRVIRETA
ncbi:MAG TPA: hypothetical protein VF174_01230 [Micromonosporaceae bacterium]